MRLICTSALPGHAHTTLKHARPGRLYDASHLRQQLQPWPRAPPSSITLARQFVGVCSEHAYWLLLPATSRLLFFLMGFLLLSMLFCADSGHPNLALPVDGGYFFSRWYCALPVCLPDHKAHACPAALSGPACPTCKTPRRSCRAAGHARFPGCLSRLVGLVWVGLS